MPPLSFILLKQWAPSFFSHPQTAQDISFVNVQALFQSLSSRRGFPTTSQSDTEAKEPSPQIDRKSVTINGKWLFNTSRPVAADDCHCGAPEKKEQQLEQKLFNLEWKDLSWGERLDLIMLNHLWFQSVLISIFKHMYGQWLPVPRKTVLTFSKQRTTNETWCFLALNFLNSFSDLIHLSRVSVTFLPMDSLHKLPDKQKYSHLFNTIYFSARWELFPLF